MSAVQRVIELPDNFSGVVGSPVFKNQGLSLPVRSLARVLGYVPEPERLGIVVVAAKPYILAVCGVEGTAEMVIKPMSAIAANGIGGTARSAEGALVLILDLAFLQAGAH
jgi:two-component system chemotaxis sensor kinase CheA